MSEIEVGVKSEHPRFSYQSKYTNSRALVIGIDKYKNAPPLSYAVSDAEEISSIIVKEFNFAKENVSCLFNKDATKEKIVKTYMTYTSEEIVEDERILIFFAGHGFTSTGKRGEVGFLVPYDADINDLASLVRWDDFTRNSELVSAKHMLFIMDACYGGLAITRSLKPGSARFVKDMLLRYSRQVLTAGKADEFVSDSGGPIPNHSVFTGHLIEALKGNAATKQGIITANAVMAYVYEKVANDGSAHQTPHYGFLDGDGDFLFKFPNLDKLSKENEKDIDELVIVPTPKEVGKKDDIRNKIEVVKKLLSDDATTIQLSDFVNSEIQRFLSLSSEDNFKVQDVDFSQEELQKRLTTYESIIRDMAGITACITYWAKPEHKKILQKLMARITDRLESQNGLTVWLSLRWYPIIIQMYCAGIAAVDGPRYDSLANIFYTKMGTSDYSDGQELLVDAIGYAILQLVSTDGFKKLPGHEKYYVPMSEYLYKIVQPLVDDVLFVGKNYEAYFDEFEVLLALAVADQRVQNGKNAWGPVGRFGWKQAHTDNPPLNRVIASAKLLGDRWEPLRNGLFGGNFDRFISVAKDYQERINGLNWF